jgi:hypothetical protein
MINYLGGFGFVIGVLAVLVFGLVLLIAVGTLAAMAWRVFSLGVAYIRYRKYLAEAGVTFDDVTSGLNGNFPLDEILTATWGIGPELPEEGDWKSPEEG